MEKANEKKKHNQKGKMEKGREFETQIGRQTGEHTVRKYKIFRGIMIDI